MPCPDSDRALTAPVSRSASTSQPTWPAWSALSRLWPPRPGQTGATGPPPQTEAPRVRGGP
eukprot:3015685-Alexandrium_andersonii.AAC.1